MHGNSFLLLPLYGNGSDFYTKAKEINDTSALSPYMGFALDSSDLENYIADIGAVNDQFTGSFQGGLYTPELYDEYLAKLETANVRGYLDEVQKQLTAWIEANK